MDWLVILLLQMASAGITYMAVFRWLLSWARRFKKTSLTCLRPWKCDWLGHLISSLYGLSLHVVSLGIPHVILLSSRIAWNSSMMAQDSRSMKMETVRPYFHHILLVKVSYKAGLDWRGRKMDPTPRREEWYACMGRGRIIWGPSLTTIIVHHLATILVPPTCKTILTAYPKSLIPWWH